VAVLQQQQVLVPRILRFDATFFGKRMPARLVAEDDRMIVPETQRYMADRMNAKIKTVISTDRRNTF